MALRLACGLLVCLCFVPRATAPRTALLPPTAEPDDAPEAISESLVIDTGALYDRYLPPSLREALAAVYGFYNVLDRLVLAQYHGGGVLPMAVADHPDVRVPNSGLVRWIYGYVRPVQVVAILAAVRKPGVKQYCEVGFNGGHSASAVLVGSRDVHVRAFDVGRYGPHTVRNAALLSALYPERFTFVRGDSQETLPRLAEAVRAGREPPCDVVLVDGDHSLPGTLRDIKAFRPSARPGAAIFIDDIQERGPGSALCVAERAGIIRTREWHIYDSRSGGKQTNKQPKPLSPDLQRALNMSTLDPERRFNHCLRWPSPSCVKAWRTDGCIFCMPIWGWAVGEYVQGSDSSSPLLASRRLVNQRSMC